MATKTGRDTTKARSAGADVSSTGPVALEREPVERRQRHQASRSSARAPRRPHHRSRHRRTRGWADPDPPRRRSPGHPHRLSVGRRDRQTSRTRPRPPAHAPCCVHHGRTRCRRPATQVQIAARHDGDNVPRRCPGTPAVPAIQNVVGSGSVRCPPAATGPRAGRTPQEAPRSLRRLSRPCLLASGDWRTRPVGLRQAGRGGVGGRS